MKNRQIGGYYWVKHIKHNRWYIAEWNGFCWIIGGNPDYIRENEFSEIDEIRIINPNDI